MIFGILGLALGVTSWGVIIHKDFDHMALSFYSPRAKGSGLGFGAPRSLGRILFLGLHWLISLGD